MKLVFVRCEKAEPAKTFPNERRFTIRRADGDTYEDVAPENFFEQTEEAWWVQGRVIATKEDTQTVTVPLDGVLSIEPSLTRPRS